MLNAFIVASEKMLECMIQAGNAEAEKRKVLLDHNVEAVEAMLQEQQALTMKMESLEKRRISAQAEAGFTGMTPEQIVAANPEHRQELSELFRNMRQAADKLQELNRASIEIARTELRIMGAAASDEGLYAPGGRKNEESGNAFSEKI